jgi:putative heme iron utilization protein
MKLNFDAIIHLLHDAAAGSLATQSVHMPGYPFASVLPFILDEGHRPVFLISGLAEHTKNLAADCRACFLIHGSDGQSVLKAERASVLGDVQGIDASAQLRARYVRYHPDAEQFLALGDFAFYGLMPKGARYIAGFGQMGWVGEADWAASVSLPAANEAMLAQELIGVPPAGIRFLGADCYGFDIERAGRRERQRFSDGPLAVDDIGAAVRRILSVI